MAIKTLCGACNGMGKVKISFLPILKKCSKCNGEGKLKRFIGL